MDVKESQKTFYDQLAGHYDDAVSGDEVTSSEKYRRLVDPSMKFKRAIDIGCGTGNWTRALIGSCESVLAVDSSKRMTDICQRKLGPAVDCRIVDVFDYPNLGTFDLVFSTFWVSHVPGDEQKRFWDWIRNMMDSPGYLIMQDSFTSGPGGGGSVRQLPSGEKFEIVKVAYDLDDLSRSLADRGIETSIEIDGATYVIRGRVA